MASQPKTETKTETKTELLEFGDFQFSISRPHSFGLVIEGPARDVSDSPSTKDYLHEVLLAEPNRDSFLNLIDKEGLVVCKNLVTSASSYRKVRGKSSHGKLSQAEYYHHDGCSCPTKPRVVEIRLPYQTIERNIHTAVARFADVVKAQLIALPDRLKLDDEIKNWIAAFSCSSNSSCDSSSNPSVNDSDSDNLPAAAEWDKIQGRITRLVRREMDAESCRAYFREVDQLADAYVLPWEMGESRLMVNNNDDLRATMQHRRAFQKPKEANEQNGSLVKRWTAEEA